MSDLIQRLEARREKAWTRESDCHADAGEAYEHGRPDEGAKLYAQEAEHTADAELLTDALAAIATLDLRTRERDETRAQLTRPQTIAELTKAQGVDPTFDIRTLADADAPDIDNTSEADVLRADLDAERAQRETTKGKVAAFCREVAGPMPDDFTSVGWLLAVLGEHNRYTCPVYPAGSKRSSNCTCGLSRAINFFNAGQLTPAESTADHLRLVSWLAAVESKAADAKVEVESLRADLQREREAHQATTAELTMKANDFYAESVIQRMRAEAFNRAAIALESDATADESHPAITPAARLPSSVPNEGDSGVFTSGDDSEVLQRAIRTQSDLVHRLDAELWREREALEQAFRLLKMAACEHLNRTGGNDYIECTDCGLMWDYRIPGQAWVTALRDRIAELVPAPPRGDATPPVCGARYEKHSHIRCEFPQGHTQNHKGSGHRVICQWPDEATSPCGDAPPKAGGQ